MPSDPATTTVTKTATPLPSPAATPTTAPATTEDAAQATETARPPAAAATPPPPVPLMFQQGQDRFSLFPIAHDDVWRMYKQAEASFWTAEEVDLASDKYDELGDGEKRFIRTVLAFFAGFDGLVNENLLLHFAREVQLPEARAFYGFQIAIENIHNETYSLLIDSYIKSKEEKLELFNAISTHPATRDKAAWALKWMRSDRPFAERLVVFACVEGVWFSGAFCSIYYIKKRGDLHLPGLEFSNSLIARDEALHCKFACLLHSKLWPRGKPIPPREADALVARRDDASSTAVGRTLPPPPPASRPIETGSDEEVERTAREAYAGYEGVDTLVREFQASVQCSVERVHEILREAVEVECTFVEDLLPVRLIGMNAELMQQYVRHVGNVLCHNLGVPLLYDVKCPFDWMESISLESKVNFFEGRVSDYQKSGVMASLDEENKGGGRDFRTDEDF